MHPPANCNNVYPLSFSTLSTTHSLPLSILFSSSSSSRFRLSFSNSNRFVSFEQRSRASGTRVLSSSSSSFLLSSRSQRRDNIRGNVHRFAINYPAACVCARDRCVPRLHRRRPANANGSAKVIIASQRARGATRGRWLSKCRLTWPTDGIAFHALRFPRTRPVSRSMSPRNGASRSCSKESTRKITDSDFNRGSLSLFLG